MWSFHCVPTILFQHFNNVIALPFALHCFWHLKLFLSLFPVLFNMDFFTVYIYNSLFIISSINLMMMSWIDFEFILLVFNYDFHQFLKNDDYYFFKYFLPPTLMVTGLETKKYLWYAVIEWLWEITANQLPF